MSAFHRHGIFRASLLLALSTGAGACGQKVPEGQVIAVVNDEEVTRRELAFEPETAKAEQANAPVALSAILDGVVDRKLAVAEARRLGLDQTPEFMARMKRLNEVMLSRTLFEKWADATPPPDQDAIRSFIKANPQQFDDRKLFLVDRIETTDGGSAARLAQLQTNDAVAAQLKAQSRDYRRERAVVDSASLAPDLYRRMISTPRGRPLLVEQNGNTLSLAVVEVKGVPPSPTEQSVAAVTGLKQVAVQDKLTALRKQAHIAYQAGYRPDPDQNATDH